MTNSENKLIFDHDFYHHPQYTKVALSIVIPTYNESKNILKLISNIQNNLLAANILSEIIIVDDNSPDKTGDIVERYIEERNIANNNSGHYHLLQQSVVRVIHRSSKYGLVSAISNGISSSSADCILVMDADFSHPPEMISKIFDELKSSNANIVIASRYTKGGSIKGWPLKRRLISKGAVKLAQYFLNVKKISDPMSGFFAFKRHVIENIKIDTAGYKILLEILVKANSKNKNNKDAITVKEIPYTFIDRQNGESKLGSGVILDYVKAVKSLSKYKKQNQNYQQQSKAAIKRKSLFSFLSQAGKFLVVGASGLLINYMTCFLLSNGTLSSMWYVKATFIGILLSMTSNFLLNKVWTFKDKNFSIGHTLRQYGLFAAISSFGAAIQLGLVYFLVQSGNFSYDFALISAVAIASISNFVLNKKWTFKERIWNQIQRVNQEVKFEPI